ncbi:MAG: hypothetical protein M3083_12120 [Actinomycetota bacterium]|nr:hypothetical protein [Actinomycetota bacterium]
MGTKPWAYDIIASGVRPPTQSGYAHPPLPARTVLYATILTEWAGRWAGYDSITFTTAG